MPLPKQRKVVIDLIVPTLHEVIWRCREASLIRNNRPWSNTRDSYSSASKLSVNPKKLRLPNELLLQIFPLLSLKSLIRAQGVSRIWRHLVPLSHLLPARRALLDLFIMTISSPAFLVTRPRTRAHLISFDRNNYLSCLTEACREGDSLPDEFRLWVLEMPSMVAIRWIWPGLTLSARSDRVGEERVPLPFRGRFQTKAGGSDLLPS
jgi:hypothetical protein